MSIDETSADETYNEVVYIQCGYSALDFCIGSYSDGAADKSEAQTHCELLQRLCGRIPVCYRNGVLWCAFHLCRCVCVCVCAKQVLLHICRWTCCWPTCQRKHFSHVYQSGGGTVKDMLTSLGCIPQSVTVSLILQVLDGLAYLHDNRVIHRCVFLTFLTNPLRLWSSGFTAIATSHRDIKPHNILLTQVYFSCQKSPQLVHFLVILAHEHWAVCCLFDCLDCQDGIPKLADFGCSRLLDPSKTSTQSLGGTVLYMVLAGLFSCPFACAACASCPVLAQVLAPRRQSPSEARVVSLPTCGPLG